MSRRRMLVASALLGAALFVPATPHAASAAGEAPSVRNYFNQDDIDRSRRYRAPAYALAFAGLGVEIVALLLIGLAAGTRRFGAFADRFGGGRWWLSAIVLAVAVTVTLALVSLPFRAGREALDRAWQLSTRDVPGFLSDLGRGLGFQLILTVAVAVGFFAVVRLLPRWWPLAAAGGAAALTVALSMLWPLVYEPLFNTFTPVQPDLRARVVALGEQSGVRVGSVLVADASRRTTRQNAYVSGLGATKRVVLYDTLLEKSSEKEVDLVVAHELAHVANSDVLKGTALGAAGAAGAVLLLWLLLSRGGVQSHLGIGGASDPKALPFIVMVLTLAGLLALPLGNWYSRRIEARADRAAIRVTNDWQTAIDVEVNLARDNISDLSPNPAIRTVFFTHPPVMERIGIALEERKRLGQ